MDTPPSSTGLAEIELFLESLAEMTQLHLKNTLEAPPSLPQTPSPQDSKSLDQKILAALIRIGKEKHLSRSTTILKASLKKDPHSDLPS